MGWLISVLIVAATAGGMAWTNARGRPTAADEFGLRAARTTSIELPAAELVISEPPTRAAAERPRQSPSLRAAVETCAANLPVYSAFARAGRSDDLETIRPALDELVAATEAGPAALATADELISYQSAPKILAAADVLAAATVRAGLLQRTSDAAFARKCFRAVFVLGNSLASERWTYDEFARGLRMMAESAAALKQLALASGDAARADSITEFDAARLALFTTDVLPIASRLRTADGGIIAVNAGNVRLWTQSKTIDRMWRIEAILALGRMRFFVGTAGTQGDQKAAGRILESLRGDDDPAVRQAAIAALGLTLEQYRQLR